MRNGSFECVIVTPDGELEEFIDPEQEEITIGKARSQTAYVIAHPGKTFELRLRLSKGADSQLERSKNGATHLHILLKLDGHPINVFGSLKSLKLRDMKVDYAKSASSVTGRHVKQKFKFSDIEVTENIDDLETGKIDMEKAQEIGEIMLKIRRFKQTSNKYIGKAAGKTPIMITKVHEKQLKGRDISQVIGYIRKKHRFNLSRY